MSFVRRLKTTSLPVSAESLRLLRPCLEAGPQASMKWLRSLWIPSKDEHFAAAEEKLLELSGTDLQVKDVPVGKGLHLHTVEGGVQHKGRTTPLVLCHGFGMGVAGWYLNYKQLSSHTHLYALDWLGMGRSSRPKWHPKNLSETEEWFTSSLDEWRKANKIDKMVLCGHSLGGYFATAYALKHPENVEHLVLASPAGVPRKPEDDPFTRRLTSLPFWQRWMVSGLVNLWEAGYSPQDILRLVGPFGPRFINGYARNRFMNPDVDTEAMGSYLYHNAAAQGSGEYSLGKVLLPFAYAREPLSERLPELKVPVTFIYGDTDWMDARHADAVAPRLKVPTKVIRVPNAGHQLFLDNPPLFNKFLLEACGIWGGGRKKTADESARWRLSWLNQDDIALGPKDPAPSM